MAQIEIAGVSKRYQDARVVGPRNPLWKYKDYGRSTKPQIDSLSLSLEDGKTTVILGPSGCGKSTLLRLVAGLMEPDEGTITYNGKPLADIPMEERKIGMVFQNYALYPHMDSESNITTWFLFKKKKSKKDFEEVKEELLNKTVSLMEVPLDHLFGKFPRQLSGGEKQRVAIARCITREPSLFLMDEPFSNLDQILRQKYRANLRRILKEFSITTVFVTHDQQEALLLGDRIALMKEGKIEQLGTFEELFNDPDSLFVASFLNPLYAVPPLNTLPAEKLLPGKEGRILGIRPQAFTLEPEGYPLAGEATVLTQTGNPLSGEAILTLELAGETVTAAVRTDREFGKGEKLAVGIRNYFLFDEKEGTRLRGEEQP